MKTIYIAIVILLVIGTGFLLCPHSPGADQIDPQALLDSVIKAEHSVPYAADQVYEAVYLGKTHRKRVHHSASSGAAIHIPEERYDSVRANYVPLVEGEDVIAGREVWTLRLMPDRDKHHWRKHAPWKQLWVDKETFVVLASREWTSTNKIKRSMVTEAVTYQEYQSQPDLLVIDAASNHWSDSLEKLKSDSRYRPEMMHFIPNYIPGGFYLEDAQCVGKSGCKFTYSDGLYCINIRGDISDCTRRDASIRDSGQCLVYNHCSDGQSITITADLPAQEFRKMIRSID